MEDKKISLPFVCKKMPENIYSLGDIGPYSESSFNDKSASKSDL